MDGYKKKSQLKEQLIELVTVLTGPNLREPLTAETEILGSNLLDSFGILQLIVEMECEFDVNIRTEDMTLENFSTICAIVDLITRYQNKS